MSYFLRLSHKTVVFFLFITVWTDIILPRGLKNSELMFWIWVMLVLSWYYLSNYHLVKYSQLALRFTKIYKTLVLILAVGYTLKHIFGIDTAYIGNLWIGYLNGFAFISLATITALSFLEAEKKKRINLDFISTFAMAIILPIGAWWLHQRLQTIQLKKP